MVWEDVEFDADKVPNIKLALHIAQIIFGFVGWCLEIVVFRAEGSLINGNVGWTFAVVRASCSASTKNKSAGWGNTQSSAKTY